MRYFDFLIRQILLEDITGHTMSQDFLDVFLDRLETEKCNWKFDPLNTAHFPTKYRLLPHQ